MNLTEDKYTKNQITAIETLDKHLLVTASAGSGKTRVLVTRICKILRDKLASVDELLVVTFTNLASLEMKQRIKSDLKELVKTDKSFLSQLDLLSTADISTLHSFCQKIIKEYFYEIGIEPNFRVLEQSEAEFLMNDALNELIEHNFQQKGNIGFIKVFKLFNEKRNDTSFKEMIVKLYNFLSSKNNYQKFLDESLKTSYETEFDKNMVIDWFNKYIDDFLSYFLTRFNKKRLEAEQINCKKLVEIIDSYISFILDLKDKTFTQRFGLLMSDISFSRLYLSKPTADEQDLKEEVSLIKDLFKKDLDNIKKIIGDKELTVIKDKMLKSKGYLLELIKFIKEFQLCYLKKKNKINALDFSDLEHNCLKILSNEKICQTLKDRYKYIFVDEYQDTNDIQEEIITKIAREDNLFMVGDIKQSIYMFRESSPQIIINRFNKYTYDTKLGKVVSLNENFRSDEMVLNFSNYIFNNIMRSETANLDYKKTAQFIYGNKFKRNENTNFPVVSVKILEKINNEKDDELAEDYDIFTARKEMQLKEDIVCQAKIISEDIKKLLNNKIYDPNTNELRNIEYSDIAILSRKKNNVIKYIVDVLKEFNIPCKASYSIKIFENYENIILFRYLELINNFNNDIALSSVLTSFMYGLSYEDLKNIKVKYQNDFLYKSILNYAEYESDNISKKINNLLNDLNMFNNYSKVENILGLLNKIVDYFHVEEYFSNQNNGKEALENIDLFKANIKCFNDISLSEYLDYVNNFAKNKEMEIELSANENAVNVITIHASKGLEFPVVFLINAEAEFSNNSRKNKLTTNQKFGLAINSFNYDKGVIENNIIKNIFKEYNSQEEKKEEMRLLYVALTRAKNHLIVVGSLELNKFKALNHPYEIMKEKSYLSWIVGSLPCSEIDKIIKKQNFDVEIENGKFRVSIIENNYQFQEKKEIEVYKNINLKDEGVRYLNQKSKRNNFALKTSVTALMNTNEEQVIFHPIINKESGADTDVLLIGNLYHLAMQYVDFCNVKNIDDINAYLNDLISKNLITEEEKGLIDNKKLLNACLFLKDLSNNKNGYVLREKTFVETIDIAMINRCESTEKSYIQGIIDFALICEDEIILVDYKTTKAINENELLEKYDLQIRLYAKAIEKYYSKEVTKKYIYSFYFDKPILFDKI